MDDQEALTLDETLALENIELTVEEPADEDQADPGAGEDEATAGDPVKVVLSEKQTEVCGEQTGEGTDLALTEMPLEETQEAADEAGALASNDGEDILVRFADPGTNGLLTKTYAHPLDQKDMNNDWYVVNKNITFDERMTVEGTVNLILCNNTTLTANEGIEIKDVAILSIWVQSFGRKMGKLVAKASGCNAGIGGSEK